MKLTEWINNILPMLEKGMMEKAEATVDEGEIKAYRVVDIIRIDFKPKKKGD